MGRAIAWKAFWWVLAIGIFVVLWKVMPPLALLYAITARAVTWANWVGGE